MRRTHGLFILFTLSVIGCIAGCRFAEEKLSFGPPPKPKLPEAVLWGVTVEGTPQIPRVITEVENNMGVEAGMIVFFLAWPPPDAQNKGQFPVESCQTIREHTAVPVLTWEPFYFTDEDEEHMIDATTICNGKYDSYLKTFAKRVKEWGHPVLIRFAHEMNIRRYHWGTQDKDAFGPQSPAKYRRMYRHVVDVFRKENADNALWVFSPNAESVPNTSFDPTAAWNTIKAFYPGDEYVDILGMDGYNWGTTRTQQKHGWESQWTSFEELFAEAHSSLRQLAPDKPLFVFETASTRKGGDRTAWIRDALKTAEDWDLAGICWFQADKETDWRLLKKQHPDLPEELRATTHTNPDWLHRFMDRQ